MDGSDGNSITKWGMMGSSNHRAFRKKGIGGKAPYLLPFFGMFGYGGTIASMHLGRVAIVSSKTKESRKVFTLHLSREALLKQPSTKNSKTTWKTPGGVRDAYEEEISLSPHQSFTQVEICGLKKPLDEDKLYGYLKDIYFPYIQYHDENTARSTRNPVEFEVNDLNLAEVLDGEVTVTNMHFCNGPDFILQLKLSQKAPGSCQAHARLKCVYFPIIQGKESIDSILEKLRDDGRGTKENFDNFPRVSVRRLGRLLPDARWGPLPFMEPKYRKGQKAELFKRCCKRVKCFVETDAGFYPTLSKTDLAQHNPFTKALRCLGSSGFDNSSAGEINIDICDKDGRLLSNNQLEKQYHDWITKMHDLYDVELDGGDDEPTLIINPNSKERLGISKEVEVIRVHTSISRKGETWRRGHHLKILSGSLGRMKSNFYALKNNFYATLEYIVVEGLQGDVCGEARLICRPIECADEQGCLLAEAEGCININIQESVSFPVSIIDDKKCQTVDDEFWNQKLKQQKEKAPSCIEVMRNLEGNAPGIGGDLPFEDAVMAGYQPPHEIVAVIRPGNCTSCSTGLLEQKYIVKDDELEMVMEIFPRSKDCPAKLIYRKVKKPSSYNGIRGLYIFPLREASCIFTKSGVYRFIFSVRCRDSRVVKHETFITVRPDFNSRRCQIFNLADCSEDNILADIRLGTPVKCLAVKSVDMYGNRIPFHDISTVNITILHGHDVLLQVDDVKVKLSSDSLKLAVMDFMFITSQLDILRPKYEAKLKISSPDNDFFGICPCEVKPGLPSSIKMDISSGENLSPGRVIDNVLLEVFDHFSNHAEEGTELNVHVSGLCFVDNSSSVRKVNGEGFIDLCGVLKVVGSFGSQACLTVCHQKKEIFSNIFQIVIRELKAVDVPESCSAGSILDHIMFEIYNHDGQIDESIDGPLHTLCMMSTELPLVEGVQYAFKHGKCVIPQVQVPREQGTITILAYHTHYPDLQTRIQIQVHALDLVLVNTDMEDGPEPISSYPTSPVPSSDLLLSSQLVPSEHNYLAECMKYVVETISDEVGATHSKVRSEGKVLETLYSRKKSLEDEIISLKDEIGPTFASFICAMEVTRQRIAEAIGTAASVLCSLPDGHSLTDDIIGIVALLGTVTDSRLTRILADYLGKEDMLAVVCKTRDAAHYIEKYDTHGNVNAGFGIHYEAAKLEVPIRRRFTVICLDAIEPYKRGHSRGSPQKKLDLPCPFPRSKQLNGFHGFAVNMINLSDESLNITTKSGYGLRETLFYYLFGELQVYETRSDMLQAIPYLKGGAISLDGGVIKGKEKLLLGYSDPKITFPVVTLSPDTLDGSIAPVDVVKKTRVLDAKKKLLETIKKMINEKEKQHEKLSRKLKKKKRKFDEISDRVSQPLAFQLSQSTPVQTPEKLTPTEQQGSLICIKQE